LTDPSAHGAAFLQRVRGYACLDGADDSYRGRIEELAEKVRAHCGIQVELNLRPCA
jgi:hypothetical protein